MKRLLFAFVTIIALGGAISAVLMAYPNAAVAAPTDPVPW